MFILLVAFLALPAIACDKGCVEYRETCACDATPEKAPDVPPSDEKPPRDKMPSYQREGINADMGKRAVESNSAHDYAGEQNQR